MLAVRPANIFNSENRKVFCMAISGVMLRGIESHDDERGYFREVFRRSWVKKFSPRQVSVSQVAPGVIKAFHFHRKQADVWYLVSGKILVGLHDLRPRSKTYGQTMSLVLEATEAPKMLLIPKMVAHGYKAIGGEPARILYLMDREFSKPEPDEGRIQFDDKSIGFDWSASD